MKKAVKKIYALYRQHESATKEEAVLLRKRISYLTVDLARRREKILRENDEDLKKEWNKDESERFKLEKKRKKLLKFFGNLSPLRRADLKNLSAKYLRSKKGILTKTGKISAKAFKRKASGYEDYIDFISQKSKKIIDKPIFADKRYVYYNYDDDIKPFCNLLKFNGFPGLKKQTVPAGKYEKIISVSIPRTHKADFEEILNQAKEHQSAKQRKLRWSVRAADKFEEFLVKNEIDYWKSVAHSGTTYFSIKEKRYRFADHPKGKNHYNFKEQKNIEYEKCIWIQSPKYLERLKKSLIKVKGEACGF